MLFMASTVEEIAATLLAQPNADELRIYVNGGGFARGLL
jgi:hypothetical protein